MSKGLRKGLIAVLVVAAVAYIGAKLYIRDQAGAALAEARYALSETVRMSYAGFSAGLGGTLTLDELTLRPTGGGGEVFIERLHIAADSLPAALGVRGHLSAGRLPRGLRVQAEDIRLNFDSPLFRRLETLTGGFLVGTPLDHLGCADGRRLNAEAYATMGYPYLGASAELRLERGRDPQAALFSADIQLKDIARIRGEAVLRSDEDALDLAALRRGTAALVNADLRYRDQGYFDSRNYYCAAQGDGDVTAFLAAHREAVARHLRHRGAVPAEAFLQAYQRLVDSPGNEFHLALAPPEPVPVRALPGLQGEALMTALGLTLAVNGERVQPVVARWITPREQAAQPGEGGSDGGQARYHPADPAGLTQLVGSFARLATYDGSTHEGLISEASDSRITMQRRLPGGAMSFDVRIGDIKRAEVYRRQPLPEALRPKPEPAEEAVITAPAEESPEAGPAEAAAPAPEPPAGDTPAAKEPDVPPPGREEAGAGDP